MTKIAKRLIDMIDYDANTNNQMVNRSTKNKNKKGKTKMKEINDNFNLNILFIKKIDKMKRKSKISSKERIGNYSNIYSSSYMKYQRIKPKGNIHNKLFDHKINSSNKSNNNSLSSNYISNLFIKIPKALEIKDTNRKNKTPNLKHNRTTNFNYLKNKSNHKSNISIELSCLKQSLLVHLLTSSLDKSTITNKSLAIKNFQISKQINAKLITKNYYNIHLYIS